MKTIHNKKTITTIACAILVVLSSWSNANEATNKTGTPTKNKEEVPPLLDKHPLLSWVRKTPVEIGCMLEQEIAYKDSVFNCSYKNYINKGDPCKNIQAYYEGVQIPDALAAKVDSSIGNIALDFEHGNLREITITFKDSMLVNNVITHFNLPTPDAKLPDNIMQINYGENVFSKDKPINKAYTKYLTITAFEHIGAGDVDCN